MRLAFALAFMTVGYCAVEGTLSVTFAAMDRSISLMIFGLDSFIEVASASLVTWRLLGRYESQDWQAHNLRPEHTLAGDPCPACIISILQLRMPDSLFSASMMALSSRQACTLKLTELPAGRWTSGGSAAPSSRLACCSCFLRARPRPRVSQP